MRKAVFIDYTGTILQNGGEDIEKMISRAVTNSKISDVSTLLTWWKQNLAELEAEAYQDAFISEEDICMKLLHRMEQEWNLRENLYELQQLNMNYWMHGPLFSDVVEFFDSCPVPIYIVSNNSAKYIRICLKRNGLHVNGIVTGDMVNAYKPHEELFRKALEVSQTEPQEVLYIGDSISSDILPAASVGMTPILLDRTRSVDEAPCRVVRKLTEVLRYL